MHCGSVISSRVEQCWCYAEESTINELPEHNNSRPFRNFIINSGAVFAALLGFPGLLIGIFGFFGVITGAKLVAGSIGAAWGYLAAMGAYELNRRKFDWIRGTRYGDQHLMAGSVAASFGFILSGAMHETMPGLALLPAISAIMQANDGHDKKYLALIHSAILATGLTIGIWFYANGVIGKILLERIEALP